MATRKRSATATTNPAIGTQTKPVSKKTNGRKPAVREMTVRANAVPERPSPAPVALSPEQVALRAYYLYQSRGCVDGFDHQDWVQAERELTGG